MAGRDVVENVDITIKATDKASKTIDDVAKAAAGIEDPDVTVHGSGADKVLADLHQLATGADTVEKSDPKIAVSITGADKASSQLRDVGDAADHAGERADAQTGGLRDISGALGDIGGTGLDAADGLIGMGETIGQVMPQLAPFASSLGSIGLAVGVGSLLYAGLQALPGLLGGASAAEEIAKKSTDELAKAFLTAGPSVAEFNKHLVSFLTDNPETVRQMNLLGVSAADISNVVNGQTSPAIDNARKFLAAYTAEANRVAQVNATGATTSNDFAKAMGLTQAQADAMADAARGVIAATDGQKTAMKNATDQTDAFNKALGNLPGTVPVEVKASDGGSLQEIIDRLHEVIRLGQATTDALGHVHVPGAGAMAGLSYASGGVYTVGEAGPERVILPRGARVLTAGQTANAARADQGGTIVNNFITVNVPVGTPTAEVGRFVADALDAHERRSGPRRRVA